MIYVHEKNLNVEAESMLRLYTAGLLQGLSTCESPTALQLIRCRKSTALHKQFSTKLQIDRLEWQPQSRTVNLRLAEPAFSAGLLYPAMNTFEVA
jgi:hypothetical protein